MNHHIFLCCSVTIFNHLIFNQTGLVANFSQSCVNKTNNKIMEVAVGVTAAIELTSHPIELVKMFAIVIA